MWPRTTEAWDPQSSPTLPIVLPGPCPVTEITLEWPVVAIVSVTVGGDTLVAGTDYRVENDRFLVRLPDDGQQRYWPYSWVNNGDFTVTYQWGVSPEPWMKDAALEVAVALLREDVSSVPALAAGWTASTSRGPVSASGAAVTACANGPHRTRSPPRPLFEAREPVAGNDAHLRVVTRPGPRTPLYLR